MLGTVGDMTGGHMHRAGRALAAAAAGVLVLAGCSAANVPPTSTPSAFGPVTPDARLTRYYDQRLQFSECDGFECATLRVPLSYEDPEGPVLDLEVLRSRSADQPAGTLVVNPGGPGGSGIAFAQDPSNFTPRLRRAFDVVGFDPRGVGRSTPIRCFNDAQTDELLALDSTPDDASEIEAQSRIATELGESCLKRSPELTPHMGTRAVARDLDVLRSALGQSRLDYLGLSYGTLIGATYAEMFPRQVGRFVLDGAMDPSATTTRLAREQALGFERALRRFAADCPTHRDCPLPSGRRAAMQRIMDFLDSLETKPLPTYDERELGQQLAILGLASGLYSKRYGWPALRSALGSALEGQGAALIQLADLMTSRGPDGEYSDNGNDASFAVNCLDRPHGLDAMATASAADRWAQRAPVFGPALAWGMLPCATWPATATNAPHRITAEGSGPIVVVGTRYDPATPYAWAIALADQLSKATLLTYEGDGHTAYRSGSRCVNDVIDDFFVDGNEPEPDIACG